MIETICQYPTNIVLGVASGIGAIGFGLYTVYLKKKLNKKFKFDWKKMFDTAWQSVIAGIGVGTDMSCGWLAILIAIATGVGVDKITNKLKISKISFLNIVQLLAKWLTEADKKKK